LPFLRAARARCTVAAPRTRRVPVPAGAFLHRGHAPNRFDVLPRLFFDPLHRRHGASGQNQARTVHTTAAPTTTRTATTAAFTLPTPQFHHSK
jgi:hypothetical protein